MELKKSAAADLEKERGLFTIMGFVFVLSALYVAFEWTDAEKVVYQIETAAPVEEDNDMTVQTQQQQAPPPPAAAPAAVIPPQIVVVNHAVTSNTNMFNSEAPKEVTATAPIAAPIAPKVIKKDDDDQTVFVVVEKNPEFVGGPDALYKFLTTHVIYPAVSKENGDQGRSICQFVVEKDGSITDIKVVRSSGFPELDNAAIDVIKRMPNWIPGEQSGKKVRVKYTLPVVFKLG